MSRLSSRIIILPAAILAAIIAWGGASAKDAKDAPKNDAAGDRPAKAAGGAAAKGEWQRAFDVKKENLASTGRGRFMVLEPGHVLHFKHGKDTLTITVTNDTKTVDGVETRVVEEREESDGKLVEVSKNYFALDRETKSVYYFGEDVDEYDKNGKVSHGGSWLAGKDGAKFGLMAPNDPKTGDRFYEEQAPQVAMDRAEVISIDATRETPAGKYEHCLQVKETSEIESGTSEKVYAPGIGLVQDDEFLLVKVEEAKKAK